MLQPDRERLAPHVRAAVDASMQRYRLEEAAAPSRAARVFQAAMLWNPVVWFVAGAAAVALLAAFVVAFVPAGSQTGPPAIVVTPFVTPGPCPSGGVRC